MIVRTDRRGLIGGLARAALVPGAALLVHQLRFMLAFGGGAGAALARQGHSYLQSLTPWIVLLVAVAVGGFLCALGRAFAGQRSLKRYTLSLAALWLVCSLCLIAIYIAQELLEGLFATGHPAGLAGVFGYGGWWAIFASACVGLVLAAILHGARWTLQEVARRRSAAARVRRTRVLTPPWPCDALVPRPVPVAGGWSGRGPPL